MEDTKRIALEIKTLATRIAVLAVELLPEPEPNPAPWIDIIDQVPTNPNASNPAAHPGTWGVRTKEETTAITIHHTLSGDPITMAKRIIYNKSLPTTQYAVWVRENGEALLCIPLDLDMWHDNSGYPNHHVSVGIAGNRNNGIAQEQLDGLVRVVAYLMHFYSLPINKVKGHCDFFATDCPGWNKGGWRQRFYDTLSEATR